jgi:hypothetical protein
VIRDAAIYIGLFFVPLTFVAMIWPATSRHARRLVEFLIAVILAKFVIVAIIGLASAAITNAGGTGDGGQLFERMIAGAALLVLAAWSPFALLRLIPMMEIAAAGVVTQRSSMSGAAQSAGIQSPAAYMRQTMDRHSRASTSPTYAGTPRTIYVGAGTSGEIPGAPRSTVSGGRSDSPTEGASRTTYPPPGRSERVGRAVEERRQDRLPPASSSPSTRGTPPPEPPEAGPPRPPREEK